MKREYRAQVQKAIDELKQENKLNGHTWKVTTDGLKWSYLDIEFVIVWDEESNMLKGFVKPATSLSLATLWVEAGEKYADCGSLEEAYYKITKMLINTANYKY